MEDYRTTGSPDCNPILWSCSPVALWPDHLVAGELVFGGITLTEPSGLISTFKS